MHEILLPALEATAIALTAALLALVVTGFRVLELLERYLLQRTSNEPTEDPRPRRRRTAPAKRLTVNRLDGSGNVSATWGGLEAATAARRVLQERQAGHTGELLMDGQVQRSWGPE